MDIFSPDPDVVAAAAKGESNDAIFLRDDEQCTALGTAIKKSSYPLVSTLLGECGAAASVFVHGYAEGSFVCALPITVQPPSSVFKHPEPVRDVDPKIISALDEHLATYIREMVATEEAKNEHSETIPITRDNANLLKYSKDYPDLEKAFGTDEDKLWDHWITHGTKEMRKMSVKSPTGKDTGTGAGGSVYIPPFDHYPPSLSVGDIGKPSLVFHMLSVPSTGQQLMMKTYL